MSVEVEYEPCKRCKAENVETLEQRYQVPTAPLGMLTGYFCEACHNVMDCGCSNCMGEDPLKEVE